MHIIISCHGIGFNISSTKVIVLLQDSQNIFLPLQLRHFRVDRYVVLRKDQGLFSYQNTFSVQHKSRIVIPNKVSHVTSQKKLVTGEELCSLYNSNKRPICLQITTIFQTPFFQPTWGFSTTNSIRWKNTQTTTKHHIETRESRTGADVTRAF